MWKRESRAYVSFNLKKIDPPPHENTNDINGEWRPFIMTVVRLLLCAAFAISANAFSSKFPSANNERSNFQRQCSSSRFSSPTGTSSTLDEQDDSEIQWDLFKRHHAKGSWRGIWTTYDYIGDVMDETIASVDLNYDEEQDTIKQTHTIVVGAKRSDCATCFDSFETKTLPVATYSPQQLHKSRLATISMVNGPTLLRSGAMATELVLKHGDGRVRVVFQHAPVWEAGVEPGSVPPQGLKLFRTMVSREALRPSPPTPESEANDMESDNKNKPTFFRGVPPFAWHKKWGGTSWTWGPSNGNRGWSIAEMEESDAWHGRPTGDSPNVWNLRLPGGILLQCPRVVTGGEAGLCRLAWMVNDDTLLRVEASVLALEPMLMDDETMVGFHPPSLGSLRCDVMENLGDLENVSIMDVEKDVVMPRDENEAKADNSEAGGDSSSEGGGDSGLDAIRDALSL